MYGLFSRSCAIMALTKVRDVIFLSDNELLLALSAMLDKKLCAQLEPMKEDINHIKNELKKINIILENDIRRDIRLLAEDYLPSAEQHERAGREYEAIRSDIALLKKVVTEHSEKLQRMQDKPI